jgi:hypothetical protein
MFCGNCGSAANSSSKFCANCGTSLSGGVSNNSSSDGINKSQSVSRRNRSILIAIGAVVSLGLGTLGVSQVTEQAAFESRQSEIVQVIPDAVGECQTIGLGFEYDYDFLIVDGAGEEDVLGATYTEIICVVEALKMPKADQSRWQNTRALDGVQEAEWTSDEGDFTIFASWSYHPNSGPDITFQLDSEFLKGYKPGAPAAEISDES